PGVAHAEHVNRCCFFSSRRRHTRFKCDWSSDVCSSDLFKVFHDYMPYSEAYQQLGAYTRQALANIGIGVTLRAQDVPTWFKRTYTNRDFDFMSNGMSHSFDPTVGVQRLYWSKNFKPGVPFSNGSGYSNPEVDRLLEAAAVE